MITASLLLELQFQECQTLHIFIVGPAARQLGGNSAAVATARRNGKGSRDRGATGKVEDARLGVGWVVEKGARGKTRTAMCGEMKGTR